MESITVAPSRRMTRALANGNAQSREWAEFDVPYAAPTGDGVFPAGHDGTFSAESALLIPICEGPAGSVFSIRVYGWQQGRASPARQTYETPIPMLLAELRCVACERAGVVRADANVAGHMTQTERFCDEISLVRGELGTGVICSPGADLIGWARINLQGCRFFELDFQSDDPVGMNCWVA